MAYPERMSTGMIRQLQENPGVPLRNPSAAVFTVDSADRYILDGDGLRVDNTPINRFIISKPQTLINGYFTRVALTELSMPWNIPNVNERNNTFTVLLSNDQPYDGEQTIAPLAVGFYTPAELATALQDALNEKMISIDAEADFVFSVTYNVATQSFTITNTETTIPWAIVANNIDSKDDLTIMMGFGGLLANPKNAQPLNLARTWVGGYASMLYTPYFDIISNNLTKKQQVGDSGSSLVTGRSLLARIYLTKNDINPIPSVPADILGCRPFTIHREFIIPKQIFWDTQEFINIVDLTLQDYKGNVLYELPSEVDVENPDNITYYVGSGSTNWQMTLQVSET